MIEFYFLVPRDLKEGNFPLTHDCILKVEFTTGSPLKFQYFSCRSHDSGTLCMILSALFCVHKVKISSVDCCHEL